MNDPIRKGRGGLGGNRGFRLLLAIGVWPWAMGMGSSSQTVFRARSDIVVIDVAVTDGRRPVASLTKNDFELRDRGVVQQIQDFDREQLPLDLTLTVDVSGSMTPAKRAAVQRAVTQVGGILGPADRLSLVTFGLAVAEVAPLQHPPVEVALSGSGGGTSILDALLLSLVTAPVGGRRQLNIFMTDGDDTTSYFDDRAVLETARHGHGQMSLVLVKGGRRDGLVMSLFRSILRNTGGEIIEIDTDERLSEAFLTAVDNFRTSYVLRYSPTGVAGSGWHDVAVQVKSKNYTVRARRGYIAN